jgi:hypothetical protein
MSRRYNELLPFGGYRQSNPFSRTHYDLFGGDAPAAPDYSSTAAASVEAAKLSTELGREQLAENKRQYENNMAVSKPVVDAQLALMNQQKEQGDDYYSYAKQYSRPAERAAFYDALGLTPEQITQIDASRSTEQGNNTNAGTPETDKLTQQFATQAEQRQQDEASSSAIADSRKGATEATNMAIRQGLRYGMSPDKIAAASANVGTQLATNQAAMANAGREKAKALNYAKKLDISGLYRGLTGVSQSAYGMANSAGNSAVGNQMQPSNAYMQGINQGNGTIMQGQQMKIGGLSSVMNAQASVYNNSDQGAGIWGALGSIGGGLAGNAGLFAKSDKNMKKDIKPADDNAALDGITKTEYSRWKYDPEKVTDAEFNMIDDKEHVGAMAQDLKKNLGSQVSDGKTVDVISAIGVNMAATKALSKKVDKLMKKGSK